MPNKLNKGEYEKEYCKEWSFLFEMNFYLLYLIWNLHIKKLINLFKNITGALLIGLKDCDEYANSKAACYSN